MQNQVSLLLVQALLVLSLLFAAVNAIVTVGNPRAGHGARGCRRSTGVVRPRRLG
ncbi:hypothetical protein OK015_11585 [Mycobacterium sp. Aquia_216]|uniref:hypothetical protein n=1 Tax=Mycobacterium sp. Aquia_216 TaxID=2991729 RepID=UPI00227C0A76|nr:hypothetical protein [Mycobacterium sp. Aquia_216]WAJ47027.1 hypothetical protein OK015_11585 [Mycobacterium sp. Aquia_216]